MRDKEIQLNTLEKKIRNDITQTFSNEINKITDDILQILEDEHIEMGDIKEMINIAKEALAKEEENIDGLDDSELKAKEDISTIESNIELVIKLQRGLITKARNTKKLYLQLLKDTMIFMQKKTYDIEKVFLDRLESGGVNSFVFLNKLLIPITKPKFKKILNIETLYLEQKINEDSADTPNWEILF